MERARGREREKERKRERGSRISDSSFQEENGSMSPSHDLDVDAGQISPSSRRRSTRASALKAQEKIKLKEGYDQPFGDGDPENFVQQVRQSSLDFLLEIQVLQAFCSVPCWSQFYIVMSVAWGLTELKDFSSLLLL